MSTRDKPAPRDPQPIRTRTGKMVCGPRPRLRRSLSLRDTTVPQTGPVQRSPATSHGSISRLVGTIHPHVHPPDYIARPRHEPQSP
jgi:hypothetical protein